MSDDAQPVAKSKYPHLHRLMPIEMENEIVAWAESAPLGDIKYIKSNRLWLRIVKCQPSETFLTCVYADYVILRPNGTPRLDGFIRDEGVNGTASELLTALSFHAFKAITDDHLEQAYPKLVGESDKGFTFYQRVIQDGFGEKFFGGAN